jgi:hypothetical protein
MAASARATSAPGRPSFAKRSKCERREDTMASSAMEKAPFSMNSTKTTMISRISIFNFYQPINRACTKASGKTVAKNQPRFPAARRWQAFCTSGRTRS